MSLFDLHFWRTFSLGIEFFFGNYFLSIVHIYIYIYHLLSNSFNHFFCGVDYKFIVALLKRIFFFSRIWLRFSLFSVMFLLNIFLFILFGVYRASWICSLIPFFSFESLEPVFFFFSKYFFCSMFPLYFPFFILCTSNLNFSTYVFSAVSILLYLICS